MDKIRTLGLYQPYAQLMLHGKLESRWVAKGKKAPFPLGRYLLYATKKAYPATEFKHLASEGYEYAMKILALNYGACRSDNTIIQGLQTGVALCTASLIKVKPIDAFAELEEAFYFPPINQLNARDADNPEFVIDGHVLWGLRFHNIKPLKTFPFKGKQGIGFLSPEDEAKIEYI